MDKLAERQNADDNIFELVRQCYCEANKDYLAKQIQIASKNLSNKQKEELRRKGVVI